MDDSVNSTGPHQSTHRTSEGPHNEAEEGPKHGLPVKEGGGDERVHLDPGSPEGTWKKAGHLYRCE